MVTKNFPLLNELNRYIAAHGPHIQRLRRLYRYFYTKGDCLEPKKGPRPLSKSVAFQIDSNIIYLQISSFI